jgi:hypothetical protein
MISQFQFDTTFVSIIIASHTCVLQPPSHVVRIGLYIPPEQCVKYIVHIISQANHGRREMRTVRTSHRLL